MSLLKKIRMQEVLYWLPIGIDEYGKTIFDVPVLTKARVDNESIEVLNEEGKKELAVKKFYLGLELIPGVYLSEDISLTEETQPDKNIKCNKIIRNEKIQKIRYNETLYLSYV